MVGAIASGQIAEYIGRKGVGMKSFTIFLMNWWCSFSVTDFSVFLCELKSLMIAAIPNVIGWLIISFSRVSSVISLFYIPLLGYTSVTSKFNVNLSFSFFVLLLRLGLFVPVHGKVIGRIRCGNNLLHGTFEILLGCSGLDVRIKRISNAIQSDILFHYFAGTRVYSWDSASELERRLGFSEPGFLLPLMVFSFCFAQVAVLYSKYRFRFCLWQLNFLFCFFCVALCHNWNIGGILSWNFCQLEITCSFG